MTPETGNLQTNLQTMADITAPLAPVVSQPPWVTLLTAAIFVAIIAVVSWQVAHRTQILTRHRIRWRLHRLNKKLNHNKLDTQQRRAIAKQLAVSASQIASLKSTNSLPDPVSQQFHTLLQQAQYSRQSIDSQALVALIQQCQRQVQ